MHIYSTFRQLFSSNQYKCGVFFMNLKGYPEPLAWIGGLPDVLAKKAVKESAELRASFGNVERKDFVLRSDQCGNILANARCFAVVRLQTRVEATFYLRP
jgi:hypothetical protein